MPKSTKSPSFTNRKFRMDAEAKRYIDQKIAQLKKELYAEIKRNLRLHESQVKQKVKDSSD